TCYLSGVLPACVRSLFSPISSSPPAPSDISPLSLHDALPISTGMSGGLDQKAGRAARLCAWLPHESAQSIGSTEMRTRMESPGRSEEHTSELQSRFDLVCRLLLEKKKKSISTEVQRLDALGSW